jgi:hypothetical protein
VSNETFSSELGDVHERRRNDRDSFNDEFRGASESLIAKDRPPLVGGRGRGAVIALAIALMLPLLIGGPIAIWYWAVPIGHWLAGTEPVAEPKPEPEVTEPVAPTPTPEPPPQPTVDKVFGIRGAPEGGQPEPTPEPVQPDLPAQPEPTPEQPDVPAGKLEAVSTSVRGSVDSTAVNANLDNLDTALLACWAKAGSNASVDLELSFGIAANGTLQAVAVKGGSEALQACVRDMVPARGWPQPRNGGEASVTRAWKLGG